MEMLFFGAILLVIYAVIVLVPWEGLQTLLAITWALMLLPTFWYIGRIVFRFLTE